MRSLDISGIDAWEAVVDPGSPPWVAGWLGGILQAYRTGDLDWVIERTHPEVEIVQPPEFPDPRTYRGIDGLIDALLDWPSEWEDFRVEPRRVFAVDDQRAAVVGIHRGRSLTMGIEVEAEIVWLFTLEDGRTRRWDMFMSLDSALKAAESR